MNNFRFNNYTLFILLTSFSLNALALEIEKDRPSGQTISLNQCIEQAKANSETLKKYSENLEQTKAQQHQIKALGLPNITFNSSTLWQDTSGLPPTSDDSTRSTQSLKKRTVSNFSIEQPLFHGFKDSKALRQIESRLNEEEANLKHHTSQLIMDVAYNFYTVLLLETRGADLKKLATLLEDRIQELHERERLGKSRQSESLSVEAELAGVEATMEDTRGQAAMARENLSFLIGQNIDKTTLENNSHTPVLLPNLSIEIEKAKIRSDVQAAKEHSLAQKFGVQVAQADHWPILDTTGKWYTHRRGFQSNIDWDISLDLEVPIFHSGLTNARVKEARSRLREAELERTETERKAKSEITQSHIKLSSTLEKITALDLAFKKSKRSYDLFVKEYRLGLVSNLDVLNALRILENRELELNQALLQSHLDKIALTLATEDPLEK